METTLRDKKKNIILMWWLQKFEEAGFVSNLKASLEACSEYEEGITKLRNMYKGN